MKLVVHFVILVYYDSLYAYFVCKIVKNEYMYFQISEVSEVPSLVATIGSDKQLAT